MKIQISQNDWGHTSVKLNGSEVGNYITEFSLQQKAGEVPVLNLCVPVTTGIEVELPQGIVIATKEENAPLNAPV